MNYLIFLSQVKRHKLFIFSLRDVKNLFPRENKKTIKNNLSRWVSNGYVKRLKRDVYEFVDQGSEIRIPDLYVANRLYGPSYVSLETALSFYSIIPEVAPAVTSVTTRPTRTFRNKYGSFYFRTCKREAFLGYRIMLYENFKIAIAAREKALVDYLYFRVRSGFSLDFSAERFNRTILKEIRWKESFRYASAYNEKTFELVKRLKEYVHVNP